LSAGWFERRPFVSSPAIWCQPIRHVRIENKGKTSGDLLLRCVGVLLPAQFLNAGGGLGGGGDAMAAWLLVLHMPKLFLQSGFK